MKFNCSELSDTPAGRLAQVNEMLRLKLIRYPAAMRLLEAGVEAPHIYAQRCLDAYGDR